MRLLDDPKLRVIDIAFELGYAELRQFHPGIPALDRHIAVGLPRLRQERAAGEPPPHRLAFPSLDAALSEMTGQPSARQDSIGPIAATAEV